MTTEKPQPNDAAGAPARGARPLLFDKTLAVLISGEMYDAIDETRKAYGVSKAVIARDWLENGRNGGEYPDES